jgi:hypothetical protein
MTTASTSSTHPPSSLTHEHDENEFDDDFDEEARKTMTLIKMTTIVEMGQIRHLRRLASRSCMTEEVRIYVLVMCPRCNYNKSD